MTEKAESKVTLSLGQKLKRAREDRALSAVELADKLKLTPKVIEDLEQENFDDLPSSAFVRGYIRSICTALSIDPEEAIALYNEHVEENPLELVSTVSAERQRKSNDPAMIWGTAAILGLAVVLLLVWAVSHLSSEEQSSALEETSLPEIEVTLSEPLVDELVEGAPAPELDETVAASEPAGEEVSEPELEQLPDAQEQLPDAQEQQNTPASIKPKAAVGQDKLGLTIQGPSWADVKDANGFQLVYGLLDAKDAPLSLTGQAPFTVFLGDATQVSITFQGQVFDHSRFIRSNNVARFSVK